MAFEFLFESNNIHLYPLTDISNKKSGSPWKWGPVSRNIYSLIVPIS